MNHTALLNFESVPYSGAQMQASAVNMFVANALRVFIEDFYQRIAPSFIVILSCRRRSPINFYRNIMQLLYDSVDNMIVQLVHYNHSAPQRIGGPRLHNLLLVDSLEALLDVEIHTYTENSDRNEYYYIFLQQRDARIAADMQAIFEYCWRHQLINCNVQIQNARGEVTVHTYFPYAATHCARIVPMQFNKFLGKQWQHRAYFPSKLHNFYGCPLAVVVRNVLPLMWVSQPHNGTYNMLHGLEGHLLQGIANRLNFTMRISALPSHANAEHNMLTALQQHVAQLAIGYIRKRTHSQRNFTSAFPHHQNAIISCVLLRSHHLTSYQLLSFPFKPLVWLCILAAFFGFTLCLMCFIRLHSASRLPNGAVLSVYAVALGMPLVRQPSRSSNQLLFTGWMFFSFLVRAMYSALLFHLQTRHAHGPLPTTLMGMLLADFTMVLDRITRNDISEIPYFDELRARRHNHMTIDLASEQDVLLQLQRRSTQKLVGVLSRDVLLHYVYREHYAGMFHITPEYVMQQQLAIYLPKHSFLVHQLDELIMSIDAAGLMNYWSRTLRNEKYFVSTFSYVDDLLRQQELMAIYVVSMSMYAFAIFVFLVELLTHRFSKK